MKRYLPLVAVCLAVVASACAQDTSAQKAVYSQIEKNLDTYKKVKARDPDGTSLTGWIGQGDIPVKILAKSPGLLEEYYTGPDGKLAFVYREWDKGGAKVEERLYMDADSIVKWVSTEKNAPVLHGEDYSEMLRALVKSAVEYSKILAPEEPPARGVEIRTETTEVKSSGQRFTEGKFLRIDEGDYFHWVMEDNATGEEASYFILKPDASVEAVVSDPEKFVGKKCRVTWKESTELLPEAGQKMDVQQILSVSWINK